MLNYRELRTQYRRERTKSNDYLLLLLLLAGIFVVCLSSPAYSAPLPQEKVILSIVGEAENQGYQGMLAVACAIRNRGTLKGVYGLRSPRVKNHKYSQATYNLALKAWKQSALKDITNGATHWENIKAFGCPPWVKGCVEVFRHKDHVFYKEIA
jgi:hypothetical protein